MTMDSQDYGGEGREYYFLFIIIIYYHYYDWHLTGKNPTVLLCIAINSLLFVNLWADVAFEKPRYRAAGFNSPQGIAVIIMVLEIVTVKRRLARPGHP